MNYGETTEILRGKDMDFKDDTILGRTGLSVSRLGIAASYGPPDSAIEMAFHEYGINFLYWGSRRKTGMRDAILNLKGSYRDKLVIAFQSYDKSGLFMRRFHEKACVPWGSTVPTCSSWAG